MNFAALSETSGVGESLPYILLLVGKIGQQIFDRAAGGNRLHNHANGHPHSPNTRFTAHHVGIDRNAGKILHVLIITHAHLGDGML